MTIDAGVLAVPNLQGTAEETHRYIGKLLDWAKLLDEPWVAISMSEQSATALFEDGLYPLRDQLKQLFSHHGIIEYDVNTVATVIDRLLMHTPSFETYIRISDILADDVTTTPDILQLSLGSRLQSDLARCVVLIAILRQHCGFDILQHSLILRSSPDVRIRVRALVHDIEHERIGFGKPYPTPPDYFEGEVLTCDDFRSLLSCIDENIVLRNATDDAGVEIAIRIALYKTRLARHLDPDWDEIEGINMGGRFGAAIRRCCQDAPPSFVSGSLRAAADAIDRQKMSAVHALRTGEGGDNPQRLRERDSAKAWRRDVDHEYHLHYWESSGGTIEFASIGVHNDFSIPE
jgi:hypothetical protein